MNRAGRIGIRRKGNEKGGRHGVRNEECVYISKGRGSLWRPGGESGAGPRSPPAGGRAWRRGAALLIKTPAMS